MTTGRCVAWTTGTDVGIARFFFADCEGGTAPRRLFSAAIGARASFFRPMPRPAVCARDIHQTGRPSFTDARKTATSTPIGRDSIASTEPVRLTSLGLQRGISRRNRGNSHRTANWFSSRKRRHARTCILYTQNSPNPMKSPRAERLDRQVLPVMGACSSPSIRCSNLRRFIANRRTMRLPAG